MVIDVKRSNFQEEVISADKLVLVDLYATWCAPCKALAPVLEELADKYADKIKVVKVNVDEEESIAVKFGIASIPTVIFFKNGQTAASLVGLRTSLEIEKMIEKLLQAKKKRLSQNCCKYTAVFRGFLLKEYGILQP